MQVASVNIGESAVLTIRSRVVETGIYKQAVSGKVAITELGLVGDTIGDTKHHGGADQAVYLYSVEDYAWWEAKLGRELPLGIFGENLTLSSFGDQSLKIGDRFRINTVLLEVTAPRIPCVVLAARMDDPDFVNQFIQAQRPGVYTRVLVPGMVQAGEAVELLPTSEDFATAIEVYNLWHAKERDPRLLKRVLQAPLAERARVAFQGWLSPVSSGHPSA